MKLWALRIFTLLLIPGSFPAISFAESSFLKALNKTISGVNELRDRKIEHQVGEKHKEFWNNAKTALSTSELELLKSDFKTTHEMTRAEVEEKYRDTFAQKELKPLTKEEKEQMKALSEISSVVLRRSTGDFVKGTEVAASNSVPVMNDDQVVPKKINKQSAKVQESPDKLLTDNQETIHTHAHDAKGEYKISKELGPDQLLLEKAVDYQNSPFAKDTEDSEETELFKRISKAYQKKYRVFSKRIEIDNK